MLTSIAKEHERRTERDRVILCLIFCRVWIYGETLGLNYCDRLCALVLK